MTNELQLNYRFRLDRCRSGRFFLLSVSLITDRKYYGSYAGLS